MDFFTTDTGRLITMIAVLIIAYLATRVLKWLMRTLYRKLSRKYKIEPGKFFLLHSLISIGIILIGVSYAISFEPNLETLTVSFLATAGVATLIVGFAAQSTLSNIVSGMVIVLFRPFAITNRIEVGDKQGGVVEEINLLYTVIRVKSNKRLIIPNSKILSNYIVNSSYSDERICEYVEFSIGYDSNIKKAKEIISEVAEAHPLCIDHRTKEEKKKNLPKVEVRLIEFGESSINLRALVWVKDYNDSYIVHYALNEKVKERFDQEGIEIPYPYQNLIFKNELKAQINNNPLK